ncbi:MAG: hypothetical protein H0W88_04510 [Parachlamydiaceae bacterium]|nr:hypothetical protein [Parachlamydiaceae bacterium]
MKALAILMTLCSIMFLPAIHAEEQNAETVQEVLINELQLDKIDFDELQKAASDEPTNLYDCVSGSDEGLDCIRCMQRQMILQPYSQGVRYVKGALCHVGNYNHSSIITVLEGYNAGLQTTVDYYGYVLVVNYPYVIECTPGGGVTYKHSYPDSTVVTGSNQLIYFR